MMYSISGPVLSKAIALVSEAAAPVKRHLIPQDPVSHTDLLDYDNTTMMKQLHVSERTLQRYRKEGKIRSVVVGGKGLLS